jgi:NTE family protein
VLRPSRDLREIAGRHARSLPWTLRSLLRGIGGWGGDWRLPSYINFSGGYCGELIRLGHRDAMARRDEIAAFLGAA